MLSMLFHLGVLAVNISTMYYDFTYIDLPLVSKRMEEFPLKGRSMYLTTWCLLFQTVYHFIALLNDIVGTNAPTQSPPTIRIIKDVLFSTAFVFGNYVTFAFWSIYSIQPTLLAPQAVLDTYPPIINHVLHTTVAVFINIDLLLPHKYYPSRKLGLALVFTITCFYTIWFFHIYETTGEGVYPMFKHLDMSGRIIFIILSEIIAISFYMAGEKLNNICSKNKITKMEFIKKLRKYK